MLAMTTFLVTALLQYLLLSAKISNRFIAKQTNFYHLEFLAKTILYDFENMAKPRCIELNHAPEQSFERILKKGCRITYDQRSFFYLVTELGEYPSLRILSQNKSYQSHHWLISLSDQRLQGLQLRIARRSEENNDPIPDIRYIKEGIVSWRRIN